MANANVTETGAAIETRQRKRELMRAYMAAQIQAIEKHKWFESEKAGFDIGFDAAAMDFAAQHGAAFAAAHRAG